MVLNLQTRHAMDAKNNMVIALDALQIGFICMEFIESLDMGEYGGEATLTLQTFGHTFVIEKARESNDIILRKRDN